MHQTHAFRCRSLAAVIAFWGVCETRAARVLVRDGLTEYRVVTSAAPTAANALAARELAAYLARATGAEFAVVAEPDGPAGAVGLYVGRTAFAEKHGVDFSSFGREESLLRTFGDDIVLCGGRPHGALYAVYDFLEKQLGCYWLDEKTEVVPRVTELKVGRLKVRRQPAFWYRDVYTARHQYWGGGAGRFCLRNKGSRTGVGASLRNGVRRIWPRGVSFATDWTNAL